MRLKIVSDGTPSGTSVVDADTGERVDGVTSIKWQIAAGTRPATGVICIEDIGAEITHKWSVPEVDS